MNILKMTDLMCFTAVKNRKRTQSAQARQASEITIAIPQASKKSNKKADKLYHIEVVEEEEGKVKVHYTGYSSDFDEWKLKKDIVSSRPDFDGTGAYSSLTELACRIKKALYPGRKTDPDVQIEVPIDLSSFKELQDRGKALRLRRKSNVFTITNYSDLL